jgi:hypothetical protein
MKIVINSHSKSNIALQHLLESLKKNDIYFCDIIVVIGGHFNLSNYEITKSENENENENITYIRANHNSIDFTGLIALLELYKNNISEYYVYLHDTCRIGKDFYNKIKSLDLTNVTSIRINTRFSMNIGIYSQSIINNFENFLLSTKNTDENLCMKYKIDGVKWEDYIFKNDKNNIILENYNSSQYKNRTDPVDYYKTGTMRIIEYYPNLDLYKFKANWGQKNYFLNV